LISLAAIACGGASDLDRRDRQIALMVPASERDVWADVARGFEASRPRASVRLVEGPNATDLRENLYTTALLAGDDSFDLVLMDVTWTPKLAAAGWLLPLDEEIARDELAALLPVAVEVGRHRGRLYRIPTRTDVGVLYYRRDWLEGQGVKAPRTFEDLVRAARSLQAPPGVWGFVWQGSQYEGLVCAYLEVLHGHGGFWVRDDTREVGLDRPEAVAALEFLRSCRRPGGISPPGVTTYKEEESRRLFQDGRAVFLRNWPYAWRLAQAPGSPLAGKVGVQAMVHRRGERGAGTLGGWGLGVSRFSRNPGLALDFVRHAVSLEGQRAMCARSGYVPARRDAFRDRELLSANPFLAELAPILEGAVPRPLLPRYALASDILQRRLSAALAGLESAETALAGAARQTRLLLGEREGDGG
jgi:multiple sugar transport system substrate-binding protein